MPSSPSTIPSPSYRILTTPPPRRSFPLPASPLPYFTGDLFDRLVLFLHKHHVAFTSIECVARGVDKATALGNGPTICVYVVQDADLTRGLIGGRKVLGEVKVKKEVVAVKEVHVVKEEGDGDGRGCEKQLEKVEETNGKCVQGEQQVEMLQTEEEKIGCYIEEVARLFRRCQFALEVPPEIRFVEFIGVIIHEDPGRIAGASGTWTNGSVMGLLTES